ADRRADDRRGGGVSFTAASLSGREGGAAQSRGQPGQWQASLGAGAPARRAQPATSCRAKAASAAGRGLSADLARAKPRSRASAARRALAAATLHRRRASPASAGQVSSTSSSASPLLTATQ